jgi:hypothetical protein
MLGKITSFLRSIADGPARTAADDMRELKLRTMGDKAQIERLVAFELKRAPGISRDEGIRRANERLSRHLAR